MVLVDTTLIRIIGGPDLIHMDRSWGTVLIRIAGIRPPGGYLLLGGVWRWTSANDYLH